MMWIKAYPEILRDKKLQVMEPIDQLAWFKLLCLACDSPVQGTILLTIEEIANALHCSLIEINHALAVFISLEMIAIGENGLKILNWDKRQAVENVADSQVDHFAARATFVAVTRRYRNASGPNGVKPSFVSYIASEQCNGKEAYALNYIAKLERSSNYQKLNSLCNDWEKSQLLQKKKQENKERQDRARQNAKPVSRKAFDVDGSQDRKSLEVEFVL